MKVTLYIDHRQYTHQTEGKIDICSYKRDWDGDIFPICSVEVDVDVPELLSNDVVTQTRISRLRDKVQRLKTECYDAVKDVEEEIQKLSCLTYVVESPVVESVDELPL